MAAVRQLACPMSLEALHEAWQNDQILPRHTVVITFDDGYADTLYEALPILQQYEIPATVFVTTGNLGQEFWWDKLERLILMAETVPLQLKLNGRSYPTDNRITLLHHVYQMMWAAKPTQQQQWLKEIEREMTATAIATNRALTQNEIYQLTTEPLIEIGAHTVRHPVLSILNIHEQRCEIQESKEFLERMTERPIAGFSYPHGDASPATRQLVQAVGFRYACASQNDIVRAATDPWQWPRFWARDEAGEQFSRWLLRWL
jgi:peptidoglycan/xylan/chitin deacetylase (PgdA/CDA1 family)